MNYLANDKSTLNYNHKALEEILGGPVKPISQDNRNALYAARVLIDALKSPSQAVP